MIEESNENNEPSLLQVQITSPLDSLIEKMEKDLRKQRDDIVQTAELLINIDKEITALLTKHLNTSIKLNIGGQIFIEQLSNLLRIKDTLFYQMFYFNPKLIHQEIFLDRSPQLFPLILDYLNQKAIDYDSLPLRELKKLKTEAEYYEVNDMLTYFASRPLELKIVEAQKDSRFNRSENVSNTIADLVDKDTSKGYQLSSMDSITFTLNYAWNIDKIYFASLISNSVSLLSNPNVSIRISLDDTLSISSYFLPQSIKDNMIMIQCKGERGKYITFYSAEPCGIGYLEIKPK